MLGTYLKNQFIENCFNTVRFKMVRFGYGSRTVIKLTVRFANDYNGSVIFN
jgi:hypothetical protein